MVQRDDPLLPSLHLLLVGFLLRVFLGMDRILEVFHRLHLRHWLPFQLEHLASPVIGLSNLFFLFSKAKVKEIQ
jgi:hypothetical protein